MRAFLKLSSQKLTALLFIAVIFVLAFSYGLRWQELKSSFLQEYQQQSQAKPEKGKVPVAIKSMEATLDQGVYKRLDFIELFGLTQGLLKQRIVPDSGYGSLYKTSYDQITFAIGAKDVVPYVDQMAAFAQALGDLDLPLLYVQAPFKLPPKEQQLPSHIRDESNANADLFLSGLEAAGLSTFDLRPAFWGSGLTQNELFFDTDHHWTIQGAFQSYTDLVSHLNQHYGFSIDPFFTDIRHYHQVLYPDFYIGSMGRRVGRTYGGVDDFTLIQPSFETDYLVRELDYGQEKRYEGSFEEAVLVMDYLSAEAPLDTVRYAVYHGDHSELILQNKKQDKGKILMIKDSFALPVYSFLSLGVAEVRALDLRLFKGSVTEYAEEYQPDLVMVLYNPDVFNSQMFAFD